MNPFIPEFEGELRLARIPEDFVARIRKRIEDGLFVPGRRSRADYVVRTSGLDEIAFGAKGLLTAYNLGLNEVSIRRAGPDGLRYRVVYWRWTWTAVAHGALIGLVFVLVFFASSEMRREVASYSFGAHLFWGLVVFFCVLWPWILSAMHRRFAENALQRILREVLVERGDS